MLPARRCASRLRPCQLKETDVCWANARHPGGMRAGGIMLYEIVSMDAEKRGMIRTQVQLTDDQARALKALSARTGLSIAELIRRGLVPVLENGLRGDEQRRRRAAAVIGRFHSGRTDI